MDIKAIGNSSIVDTHLDDAKSSPINRTMLSDGTIENGNGF
jgi:hypothetical protein